MNQFKDRKLRQLTELPPSTEPASESAMEVEDGPRPSTSNTSNGNERIAISKSSRTVNKKLSSQVLKKGKKKQSGLLQSKMEEDNDSDD